MLPLRFQRVTRRSCLRDPVPERRSRPKERRSSPGISQWSTRSTMSFRRSCGAFRRALEITQSTKLWKLFGTQGPVEPGKVYGSVADGTARLLNTPGGTHPWNHLSKTAIGDAVAWFQRTLSGGTPKPPQDQVWYWKELGTGAAFVGFVVFVLGLFDSFLRLPYFVPLRSVPIAGVDFSYSSLVGSPGNRRAASAADPVSVWSAGLADPAGNESLSAGLHQRNRDLGAPQCGAGGGAVVASRRSAPDVPLRRDPRVFTGRAHCRGELHRRCGVLWRFPGRPALLVHGLEAFGCDAIRRLCRVPDSIRLVFPRHTAEHCMPRLPWRAHSPANAVPRSISLH